MQFAQGGLELGNDRGQFLAGLDRRIAGEIAGLKQLVQGGEGGFRHTTRAEMLFDDGFRDGGGRQVEALAQLLLQEAEQGGKEVVGLVVGGVLPQFEQALPDDLSDLPAAAQAGIVGELLRAAAPDDRRKPGEHGHGLERQEPGLLHQRRTRSAPPFPGAA